MSECRNRLPFKADWCSIICIYNFVHPLICQRTTGCFHSLALMNNAARNMRVQVSLCGPAFNQSRIQTVVESLDHIIIPFSSSWGIAIPFSTVAAPSSFPWREHKWSNRPESCQHLLFFCFIYLFAYLCTCLIIYLWTVAILMGVRWSGSVDSESKLSKFLFLIYIV